MKFLADMGIARSTVEWLRASGYDATHLLDEGLERLPDREIVQKARSEGRCVLTVDLDFAQIVSVGEHRARLRRLPIS